MAKETANFAPKFTRTAQVTADVLKMEIGKPYYIKILSAIEESQAHAGDDSRRAGKEADGKMEPAQICRVIDLEVPGAPEQILIVNSVLKGILEDSYTDKATGELKYVGKSFEVTKRDKVNGKRYHTFQVYEVAVEA
jgi:hypothetical protein